MSAPGSGDIDRQDVERLLNLIATDPAVRRDLLVTPALTLQTLGLGRASGLAAAERQCDYTCIVSGTCSKSCQVTCDVTGKRVGRPEGLERLEGLEAP
jgi:hypothetical protein